MIIKFLVNFLIEPSLKNMDIDGQNRLSLHSKIIARKRMLREVFIEMHTLFHKLNIKFLSGNGRQIELGAGVSPMRDSYPEVLSTDIITSPDHDFALNAEAMDLPDGGVKVFYGQNCFHHFPHPDAFFYELERVLAPGGGAILIDPYY